MNLLLLPRYDLVTLIIAMSLSVATSRSISGTNGRSPVRSGGRLRVEGGCARRTALVQLEDQPGRQAPRMEIGRASCRERMMKPADGRKSGRKNLRGCV